MKKKDKYDMVLELDTGDYIKFKIDGKNFYGEFMDYQNADEDFGVETTDCWMKFDFIDLIIKEYTYCDFESVSDLELMSEKEIAKLNRSKNND